MNEMKELTRAKIHLLMEMPFYSYLVLHLDQEENPTVLTAATDGAHLFYNPDWIRSLNDLEIQGVLCHEVLHCALAHLVRRGTRDPWKWNIATDFAVNALLLKDGLTLPKGCLYDKTFEEKAAEEIYKLLPDPPSGCGGCQGPAPGQGGTLDDHRVWGRAMGKGDGEGEKGQEGEGDGDQTRDKDTGPSGFDPIVWKERVARAAAQARMQGKLPAHIESLVGDLLHPKLDWRVILRDFITASVRNNYRLYPPNKRYLWMPIYLPSVQGETVEVAVAVDTSGSISDQELKEFLSEVRGIMDQFEDYTLHIIQCDARVHAYDRIGPHEGELPRKMKGRGGTDFRPVFDLVEKERISAPVLCYMTDLYGTFPDRQPPYQVIWIATTDQAVPWGEVIRLREDRR